MRPTLPDIVDLLHTVLALSLLASRNLCLTELVAQQLFTFQREAPPQHHDSHCQTLLRAADNGEVSASCRREVMIVSPSSGARHAAERTPAAVNVECSHHFVRAAVQTPLPPWSARLPMQQSPQSRPGLTDGRCTRSARLHCIRICAANVGRILSRAVMTTVSLAGCKEVLTCSLLVRVSGMWLSACQTP